MAYRIETIGGVAKSYANLERVSEPYWNDSHSKMYVDVVLKSGKIKAVRFYGDSGYNYNGHNKTEVKSQKEVLGFNPSILIFRGETYPVKEKLKEYGARYHKIWGWYLIAEKKNNYRPIEGITPIELNWELVGNEDGTLKTDIAIQTAIEPLLYPPTDSEYVGEIGERLQLKLKVVKVFDKAGDFGETRTHIFKDAADNTYSWTTASRYWEVGSERVLRGTVKAHNMFKGDKTTILTRCKAVE